MVRTAWTLALPLAAASLLLLGTGRATAQAVVSYYPAPAVSCYNPPVAYAPAPQVSYYAPAVTYYTPAVSYYAAPAYAPPAVAYYAPSVAYYAGPTAVTTTRYGLFGRPRYSTTRYYP